MDEKQERVYGSVPVPDPTLLTTVQLNREIASVKEVIFVKMEAIVKQMESLRELHDEKFQSSKDAIVEQNRSSAMAIAKSEAATTKQIDQLGMQMHTRDLATNDKIDDIKSRLTLIEGKGFGSVATELGHQSSSSFIVALVIASVAVAGFFVMIAEKVIR